MRLNLPSRSILSGRGSPDRASHWTRSPNGAATLVKAATRLALLSSWRALLAAQAAASRSYSGSSPDVALQHPGGAGFASEHLEALLQDIGTTTAFAKAIGVSVGQSLGYGGEGKRVKRLHSSIVQGGDAQGAQFAVGLGDVNAAQGPGSVSVTFEVEGRLKFLSIGSPSYIIYTGRVSAPVRRDPMHGQEFGRARVSQDPLQGSHLAPVSCLCGLGNTHLQPPNLLPDAGPINGFPRQRRWGGRRIS